MPHQKALAQPKGSVDRPGGDFLARKALGSIVKFQVALALLFSLTAGTVRYWQAWVFWTVFGLSMLAVTLYFLRHDRHLVENRLEVGPAAESRPEQKAIQTVAGILVFLTLALPGLDHRWGWSAVPAVVAWLGDVLVALGFLGMFLVFRSNTHAAATVKVEAEQRVISTGPYGFVRHPMYSASLVLFAGMALALGSWWTLLVTLELDAALVARLLDEERYLTVNLPGYPEYCRKVPFRLIPFVW